MTPSFRRDLRLCSLAFVLARFPENRKPSTSAENPRKRCLWGTLWGTPSKSHYGRTRPLPKEIGSHRWSPPCFDHHRLICLSRNGLSNSTPATSKSRHGHWGYEGTFQSRPFVPTYACKSASTEPSLERQTVNGIHERKQLGSISTKKPNSAAQHLAPRLMVQR